MNGLNRTSLLVGMLVALLALFSSVAFAEENTENTTTTETENSFDQKYLLPDYIAYSGIESVAAQALNLHTAASFDINFLTPGSIVHTLNTNADSTVVQVVHWQAVADTKALAFLNLEDFENKSLTAVSTVSHTPGPVYVAHGDANGIAAVNLEASALEDFENKSLFADSDITWAMQQAMATPNLEDFENKSLDTQSIASQTSRPVYVAHGGANGITSASLAVSNLEDFENKSLTVADATKIQVAHWQTMTGLDAHYGTFTVDDETIATAAAFDANYFTPGSIVRTLEPEMASVHAARWQAMADYYAQHGMLTIDNNALVAASAGQ